jgi:alanyl-tRNA synthetase
MKERITSDEVRRTFLEFFVERGHQRIAEGSLIPQNDRTLLFINSGMAPLKPYFTGQQAPPRRELCNVQPCLRTIDIDDVGDRHHLTFFEMLGSWSIGGYFKDRAIALAYELLTDRYGLDPRRLYVSVFGGDEAAGLPPDLDSIRFWEEVGIPRDRIVALGLNDNFWGPAGDTGPCGPCTEVFYDFGPAYGDAFQPGDVFDTSGRYIEIWNAGVFMQFDKKRDGSFDPLPFFSVDTGAGLERLTMALNELPTVYDIDLFVPLVSRVQELLNQPGEVLSHHRLLADHVRAATFVLAEGVRPSNEGRGYVPRRLIRKCIAVARLQGAAHFDLSEIAEVVISLMGPHYPMLVEQRDKVLALLSGEEREFSLAVERGLEHLEKILEEERDISGADAFRLFSTYGLPVEITRDLAGERGLTVDERGYQDELRRHRQTSRAGGGEWTAGHLSATDPLPDLPLPLLDQFVGYESDRSTSRVVALFVGGKQVDELHPDDEAELLLDTTPFYAEGGGQVGDSGGLTTRAGARFVVDTTRKHSTGYHVHRGRLESGVLVIGDTVDAEIDVAKRRATEANHSATHLLNAALREVLGAHVRQAGSLVEPARLRFDFTNPRPVTPEELIEIERWVNRRVLEQNPLAVRLLPLDEAEQTGAIFLQDEEYTSPVRVIAFDDVSIEFCGGTHVANTSAIGLFKILGEQSVASGVRRINAATREAAIDVMLERDRTLNLAAAKLKINASELPARIERLLDSGKGGVRPYEAGHDIEFTVDQTGALPMVSALVGEDVDLRRLAIERAEALDAVVALAGLAKGRSRVAVAVPAPLAKRVDARVVLQELLEPIAGRGGGSARMAEGGGDASDQLEEALSRLGTAVDRALASSEHA